MERFGSTTALKSHTKSYCKIPSGTHWKLIAPTDISEGQYEIKAGNIRFGKWSMQATLIAFGISSFHRSKTMPRCQGSGEYLSAVARIGFCILHLSARQRSIFRKHSAGHFRRYSRVAFCGRVSANLLILEINVIYDAVFSKISPCVLIAEESVLCAKRIARTLLNSW